MSQKCLVVNEMTRTFFESIPDPLIEWDKYENLFESLDKNLTARIRTLI